MRPIPHPRLADSTRIFDKIKPAVAVECGVTLGSIAPAPHMWPHERLFLMWINFRRALFVRMAATCARSGGRSHRPPAAGCHGTWCNRDLRPGGRHDSLVVATDSDRVARFIPLKALAQTAQTAPTAQPTAAPATAPGSPAQGGTTRPVAGADRTIRSAAVAGADCVELSARGGAGRPVGDREKGLKEISSKPKSTSKVGMTASSHWSRRHPFSP